MMPKVSVVIPSYNHAKFIGPAIQSVLDQTYQDFEILIRDDASKDNSVDIIRQFNDKRIKIEVNSNNMGACHTLNSMIKDANGEYIALLNSDDIWLPNKLEIQVDFLDKNLQYVAVFSDVQFIKEDGDLFSEYPGAQWFTFDVKSKFEWMRSFFELENHVAHPTMLIRKYVYDTIGFYNTLMSLTPDFEMWVRLLLHYEFYVLPEKLIKFRILDNGQNASGATLANQSKFAFEAQFILDNFLEIPDLIYLSKIFPDFVDLISFNTTDKDIPLIVGLIATKNKNYMINNWGAKVIYQIFKNNHNEIEYYKKIYGINELDFTLLINNLDINQIKLHSSLIERLTLEKDEKILEQVKQIISMKDILTERNYQIKQLQIELFNILASRSWRITNPLRKISSLIRKILF
jgi:glycosyltransferase involved in cell wall biosynthesis